jgi:ubiquinone/menaquinone biosynthesis C-methylase UbiE
MNDENVKKNVREFYDQVGWQMVEETLYQNAQYEDLRPVSQEYIHRCHMRVKQHLEPEGQYLLDAGSGPVQYPEYLTYSAGYHKRVCMDISIVALREARKRLGEHGLYVVADIARLPFKDEVFDGIVSLHTIHHIPTEEKIPAYEGLYRTLIPGKKMVVVNGWTRSPLMKRLDPLMNITKRLRACWLNKVKRQPSDVVNQDANALGVDINKKQSKSAPSGTYVQKLDAQWLTQALSGKMDFKILVWRSVSVRFLRSVIYPDWGGRFWLKVMYWLEERFPRYLGRVGQYPLLVVSKPQNTNAQSQDASKV